MHGTGRMAYWEGQIVIQVWERTIVFAKSALPSVSATDSSGAHAIDTGDRSALAAPGGYRASTPNAGSLRDENMTRCEVKSWPAEVPWLGAKRGGG